MKTLEEIEAHHEARAARKASTSVTSRNNTDFLGEPLEQTTGDMPGGTDESDDYSDPRDTELQQLRQQLSAMQGRVAPSQQQADEYRRFYDEERRMREAERAEHTRQIEELREQLDIKKADFDVNDILSEDEKYLFDESQLAVFKKIANAAVRKVDVKSEAAKLMEERELRKVASYREDKLTDPRSGIAQLAHLAQDSKFIDWTNQEENDDFDHHVRSLLTATTEREVDRYVKSVAKRIARFNESRSSPTAGRKTDAKTSLHRAMQRRPSGSSNSDMSDKISEATRLARSRNPDDRKKAESILNSL